MSRTLRHVGCNWGGSPSSKSYFGNIFAEPQWSALFTFRICRCTTLVPLHSLWLNAWCWYAQRYRYRPHRNVTKSGHILDFGLRHYTFYCYQIYRDSYQIICTLHNKFILSFHQCSSCVVFTSSGDFVLFVTCDLRVCANQGCTFVKFANLTTDLCMGITSYTN